jgi:hypothetical protein
MELTQQMRSEMNFAELDKSYMPGQEKLPVIAYQLVKQVIRLFVYQHLEIKRLEKVIRDGK